MLGTVPAGSGGAASGSATIMVQPGTERVRFTNLEFKYNTWLEPSSGSGFVDLQSGYFFSAPATGKGTTLHGVPGVLAMHGANDINVTNCTFMHIGLTGVLADEGSKNIRVTHSRFGDISGSASHWRDCVLLTLSLHPY